MPAMVANLKALGLPTDKHSDNFYSFRKECSDADYNSGQLSVEFYLSQLYAKYLKDGDRKSFNRTLGLLQSLNTDLSDKEKAELKAALIELETSPKRYKSPQEEKRCYPFEIFLPRAKVPSDAIMKAGEASEKHSDPVRPAREEAQPNAPVTPGDVPLARADEAPERVADPVAPGQIQSTPSAPIAPNTPAFAQAGERVPDGPNAIAANRGQGRV